MMTSPGTTGGEGINKTNLSPHFDDPLTGTSAFSRVLHEFSIPSGDYAVVTYRLNCFLRFESSTSSISVFTSS